MRTSREIEHSLITAYKYPIWRMFTKALKVYDLIQEGDKICVCISGGKDSMLMALCFKHLIRYSDFPFEVKYLVMNPGYNEENLNKIKENIKALDLDCTIMNTDIFSIANNTTKKPCYLCAKMRRGALYRIAKEWGCNKIALGHHYDDVIVTTLMNMLNSGSFQTMLPKLHSDHYEGMEIIRPLYFVRERDIVNWSRYNGLDFIRCACRFTENIDTMGRESDSMRYQTKLLIEKLMKEYSPVVEKNIFKAAENVYLDKVLGYVTEGEEHSFLEDYQGKGEKIDAYIRANDIEKKALEKADREHAPIISEKKD